MPAPPAGTLQIATVAADSVSLASAAPAVADRIAAGNAALRSATVVRAGVEVRSGGDLVLFSDWHDGSTASTAVTLRAAGNVQLSHSLTTGLAPAAGAAADALPSVPIADGGALRVVAGADLASALPTAVVAGSARGITLGRAADDPFSPPPTVALAASTGRIQLAAAGDIRLLNDRTAVYTTGVALPADTPVIADIVPLLPGGTVQRADGQPSPSPFLVGGGRIDLQAGNDVLGVPGTPYITDWWWRNAETGAWYARYRDAFASGIATFGGGDVRIAAGRDIRDVDAVAANSGYTADAGHAAAVFGGGSVALHAGRDVVAGLASASGPTLSVQAGGAIRASSAAGGYEGLQADYQATDVRIESAGDATVGAIKSAGRLEPAVDNVDIRTTYIGGLDTGARLVVGSWGGDLRYLDKRLGVQRDDTAPVSRVIPADATWAAWSGSITLGDSAGAGIVQRPVASGGRLQIAAAGSVRLGSVSVQPVAPGAPIAIGDNGDQGGFDSLAGKVALAMAEPVRVTAAQGDIHLLSTLAAARPLRLVAGRDIAIDGPNGGLLIVHPPLDGPAPATPLSLLDAGRDIVVGSSAQLPFSTVSVRGGGDLLVLAGRDVDLGSSLGVVSRGNLDDGIGLAEGGAGITVVAGVRRSSGDYVQAARRGFVLLGGGGVADRAGELAALLQAVAAGQPLPAPGGSVATAFDALAAAARLDRARALLGDAFYDATLLATMQALQGSTALTTVAAARTAFDALATFDQSRVVGNVLATGYDRLDAAMRSAFVLQNTDAASARAKALIAATVPLTDLATALTKYNRLPPGPLTLQAALTAYDQLPPEGKAALVQQASGAYDRSAFERQVLLTNRVLFDDLRSAGRAAAVAAADADGGSDPGAAYARGYAALASVFPGVRTAGRIAMTTSQIKTQQGGSITLLVPGGGIDAGALASAGTPQPNTQGIVTVAGGDIQAAARDDFAVNQSRVFTLARGDILLWSSEGNLDAGRGAKTVRGAPQPVFRLDANGNVVVDTSGSFTGSGIAVLDAASSLDLYAPRGEINAGEAGIQSAGNAFFGAQRFVGTDNLAIGGVSVGAPPPVAATNADAGLSSLGASVAAAATAAPDNGDDDEKRKRRRRRNFFLDFLGFGQNE